MTVPDKAAATRAFIRDLNILVKQVGMYGPQHQRSVAQFDAAWKNLREALQGRPALQIGVAGERIVLDGAQVTPGPAERGLIQFFTSVGIVGIQVLNTITAEEFSRLVRSFAAKRPAEVLPHLKQELSAGLQHSVRVLEPQFMSAGSMVPEPVRPSQLSAAESAPAADIAAASPGSEFHEPAPWLSDPRKLLELQTILRSGEAWRVPPANLRSFIGELRGQEDVAREILANYCRQLENSDPEARRKTAVGVGDMAGLLGNFGLLQATVRLAAGALLTGANENAEFVSALMVLMHEAGNKRDYAALEESLAALDRLRAHSPKRANDLRAQMAVEARVPDFIQEALGTATASPDLIKLLQRMPASAGREIVARFGRAAKRDEPERLLNLLTVMRGDALEHVRHTFRSGSPPEAVAAVGLLSRADITELENSLPARIAAWDWQTQRECVRQISVAGAPRRGPLLLKLLGSLHTFALPGAIDEIGVCGKMSNPAILVEIAQGGAAAQQSPYLQVKAVEALGILHETSAVPVLTNLLMAKHWNWDHPRELRIAAAQSLLQIDPQKARKLVDGSGLDQEELRMLPLPARRTASWTRPRRYVRVSPERVVVGIAKLPAGECRLGIDSLSLSGGLGTTSFRGLQATDTVLELQVGFRPVRAHVLLREVRPHQCAFEILDIDLEDRLKLRRYLMGQPEEDTTRHARAAAAGTSPK